MHDILVLKPFTDHSIKCCSYFSLPYLIQQTPTSNNSVSHESEEVADCVFYDTDTDSEQEFQL